MMEIITQANGDLRFLFHALVIGLFLITLVICLIGAGVEAMSKRRYRQARFETWIREMKRR